MHAFIDMVTEQESTVTQVHDASATGAIGRPDWPNPAPTRRSSMFRPDMTAVGRRQPRSCAPTATARHHPPVPPRRPLHPSRGDLTGLSADTAGFHRRRFDRARTGRTSTVRSGCPLARPGNCTGLPRHRRGFHPAGGPQDREFYRDPTDEPDHQRAAVHDPMDRRKR